MDIELFLLYKRKCDYFFYFGKNKAFLLHFSTQRITAFLNTKKKCSQFALRHIIGIF